MSTFSVGDASLGFRTNRLGLIERVIWAGDNALGIAHTDTDRVKQLRFDLDEAGFGSEYRYDEAGFRVAGHYNILESSAALDVALEYDSAGNIVRIEQSGPDGETRTTRHVIGAENELLKVTPLVAPAFEQVFEYDGSGRAVRAAQGNGRDATFRYDDLGRLTDVYLDGEHVLTRPGNRRGGACWLAGTALRYTYRRRRTAGRRR